MHVYVIFPVNSIVTFMLALTKENVFVGRMLPHYSVNAERGMQQQDPIG